MKIPKNNLLKSPRKFSKALNSSMSNLLNISVKIPKTEVNSNDFMPQDNKEEIRSNFYTLINLFFRIKITEI